MPNLPRSPPLNKSLSMSESDVNKVTPYATYSEDIAHITQRDNKRRRVADEPTGTQTADLRSIIREELRDVLIAMQSQQNARLDILEEHIAEIKGQNETTHKKNTDIEKSIDFVTAKVQDLQLTINNMEEERSQLATKITAIEAKCDTLERLARKTSIQIRNVPKQKAETKEQLYQMVKKLSLTLGINLETSEVRDIYRMPSKSDQTNTAVIAEFSSTLTKGNFLTAVKNHKSNCIRYKTEQLNSTHLGLEGNKSLIYISEHLTPQASRLYFLAREFRKTLGYEYCWTSNGLIYLREKQGKPYILVKNEAQLHQLKSI